MEPGDLTPSDGVGPGNALNACSGLT
jgi:hypothetical protein